jgi:hypothetical protein
MLYIKEIFDSLAYGELTNMAVSKASNNSINPSEYLRIVSYINEGLLDLYTRFTIRTKEFDLYQRSGVTRYYIRSAHLGDPTAGDDDIYIDNTQEDSIDADIIRLITAYDSLGNEVRINNAAYPDDFFNPEPDILTIVERDPVEVFSIKYQAAYPKISLNSSFDPATYELHIPAYIVKPLKAIVASKLFTGKAGKTTENNQSLQNTFLHQYEIACAEIVDRSLIPQEREEDERFTNNGWT